MRPRADRRCRATRVATIHHDPAGSRPLRAWWKHVKDVRLPVSAPRGALTPGAPPCCDTRAPARDPAGRPAARAWGLAPRRRTAHLGGGEALRPEPDVRPPASSWRHRHLSTRVDRPGLVLWRGSAAGCRARRPADPRRLLRARVEQWLRRFTARAAAARPWWTVTRAHQERRRVILEEMIGRWRGCPSRCWPARGATRMNVRAIVAWTLRLSINPRSRR
jgi:hypothetical protein